MNENFWKNLKRLKRPIIGMAPMDGVTDIAFRQMVCKHSNPSVIYTEFVNVEGLARGAIKMLHAFRYFENERPVVGQIFGVEVESFYKAAVMLCYLGFNGIDINMGCPVNKVAKKGSGAGLIRTPDLARDIIRTVKKASKDWSEGITLKEAGVHGDVIEECKKMKKEFGGEANKVVESDRRLIPVSVKTRIGYEKPVTEDWIKNILEENPDSICVHGRTLKQLYSGEADWEEIGKAGKLCRNARVCFLGNGDVKSMEDAKRLTEKYEIDGVLVGRAVTGNPWFFGEEEGTKEKMLNAVLEHCELFERFLSDKVSFVHIKKHLGWYCKGFDGAKELRMELMKCENVEEVAGIVEAVKRS